ncbi:MAG: 4-hydroxy-tetrahydrodipicolinate reductase [Candidatus Bathyarchaeota archaeon]|nr:4-hydroxy-tetrahydrodipicolinate reductase [Candidatus Bathyarchaeota archaeon]
MGRALISEATAKGHQVVGAIEAPDNPCIGKSLSELGISHSKTCIVGPDQLKMACAEADVYVSFTLPPAEMRNIPTVVDMGKRVVLGTTGFTAEQKSKIESLLSKVPSVFAPNYSVGVNILFKLAEVLKAFPAEYTCSINEIHHTAKKDAPSGTALKLGEIVSNVRGYTKNVYGREGTSIRQPEELEIAALRAGGVPGIHDLIVAGPYEMLKIQHTAFSRNCLSQGAIYAAEWVSKQQTPGVYSMATVLGL